MRRDVPGHARFNLVADYSPSYRVSERRPNVGSGLHITAVALRQYRDAETRLTILRDSPSQIYPTKYIGVRYSLQNVARGGKVTPDQASLCAVEFIDDTGDIV